MQTKNLTALYQTILTLRGESGCPWDKRQTPQSLIKYIRAETDELVEAIEAKDVENICEEAGDVLYLLCMISAIYAEKNQFTFDDIAGEINEKLIRRHPHVFAGTSYKDEADLARQWEEIKREEKTQKKRSCNVISADKIVLY